MSPNGPHELYRAAALAEGGESVSAGARRSHVLATPPLSDPSVAVDGSTVLPDAPPVCSDLTSVGDLPVPAPDKPGDPGLLPLS